MLEVLSRLARQAAVVLFGPHGGPPLPLPELLDEELLLLDEELLLEEAPRDPDELLEDDEEDEDEDEDELLDIPPAAEELDELEELEDDDDEEEDDEELLLEELEDELLAELEEDDELLDDDPPPPVDPLLLEPPPTVVGRPLDDEPLAPSLEGASVRASGAPDASAVAAATSFDAATSFPASRGATVTSKPPASDGLRDPSGSVDAQPGARLSPTSLHAGRITPRSDAIAKATRDRDATGPCPDGIQGIVGLRRAYGRGIVPLL